MTYEVFIQYHGIYVSSVPFMGGLYQFGRGDVFAVNVQHASQMLGYLGVTPDQTADPKRNGRNFLLTSKVDFDRMLADGHLLAGTDPETMCTVGALLTGGGDADETSSVSEPGMAPVKPARATKTKA